MAPTEPPTVGAARRILLCPGGSRGDVQPMVALALRLQATGHQVLMAAAPNYASWMERLNIPFYHLLDQFYWGHHLWQRGLAPKPLRKSKLSPENFATALLTATQDGRIAERAAETGVRLRQVDGVAVALKDLLAR